MSQNEDFHSLIQQNTRSEDEYINATKWCQHFGKRWSSFQALQGVKRFIFLLSKELSVEPDALILRSHVGRGYCTLIHPRIAERLLEWLEKGVQSIKSERVVRDELARQVGGRTEVKVKAGIVDVLTEKEVIEVKPVKAWKCAVGQVLIYALDLPGTTPRIHLYGKCSNEDKELIKSRCAVLGVVVTWRKRVHRINPLELSLVSAAEELEEVSIKRNSVQGDEAILHVVKEVAHDIASLRRKYAGE